jgi:hypothetical protein
LLHKTELEITYLPDVITACANLHNLLLGQTTADVERLLGILEAKGWREQSDDEDPNGVVDDVPGNFEVGDRLGGMDLQHTLGVYLAAQRRLLAWAL